MNSLWNVIKADWNNGVRRLWGRFAIVSIITGILCGKYLNHISSYLEHKKILEDISLIEYIVYLFRGMEEFIPMEDNMFELPVSFILIYLILAYMVGDYAVKDLGGSGRQMIVKSGKRSIWWISKCIWNITTVLLFYVSILFGALIIWIINGSKGGIFVLSDNIIKYILGIKDGIAVPTLSAFLLMFFVVMCTSVAISLCQMSLSFFIKPTFSFMIVAILYVVSGYYLSEYLLGNYMMLYRSSEIVMNGVSIWIGLSIDAVLIIVSIGIGYLFFRKHDLLQ